MIHGTAKNRKSFNWFSDIWTANHLNKQSRWEISYLKWWNRVRSQIHFPIKTKQNKTKNSQHFEKFQDRTFRLPTPRSGFVGITNSGIFDCNRIFQHQIKSENVNYFLDLKCKICVCVKSRTLWITFQVSNDLQQHKRNNSVNTLTEFLNIFFFHFRQNTWSSRETAKSVRYNTH